MEKIIFHTGYFLRKVDSVVSLQGFHAVGGPAAQFPPAFASGPARAVGALSDELLHFGQ